MTNKIYDVAIIGGGLGGLSLAILQAKTGRSVILFEKNEYPFHRVCGEYISMESWDFLKQLGLNLDDWDLPKINKLVVSAPSGLILQSALNMGGFGISRFKLDHELALRAVDNGVKLLTKSQVDNVNKSGENYEVISANSKYISRSVVGAFGKRSNLDINWKRAFIQKNRETLNQYIGVKYHIKYEKMPKDIIALHNFKNGYCGISAIENDTYCLCYLTTKQNLKASNNKIEEMEKQILRKNPHLNRIFETAHFLWKQPEIISQISFETKENYSGGISLIGDAAGLIAPLCGNGMSMAFAGAVLLHQKLEQKITTESEFQKIWDSTFKDRMWVGKTIQRFFGDELMTLLVVRFFKLFPNLLSILITKTHGKKIEI